MYSKLIHQINISIIFAIILAIGLFTLASSALAQQHNSTYIPLNNNNWNSIHPGDTNILYRQPTGCPAWPLCVKAFTGPGCSCIRPQAPQPVQHYPVYPKPQPIYTFPATPITGGRCIPSDICARVDLVPGATCCPRSRTLPYPYTINYPDTYPYYIQPNRVNQLYTPLPYNNSNGSPYNCPYPIINQNPSPQNINNYPLPYDYPSNQQQY